MKTMSLCAVIFALLLALIAYGVLDDYPSAPYILIFFAAAGWAILMWLESDTTGDPK